MMMFMPTIPVSFFKKAKAKPDTNAARMMVTVADERGNMYRRLTVAELAVDYRTSYVCDGTGEVIGQVRNVLTGSKAIRRAKVYYILPKSFRLPSSSFSLDWKQQSANVKQSEAKGKHDPLSQQSLVFLLLGSPTLPVPFVADESPLMLRNANKANSPSLGSDFQTTSPMNRSKSRLPALETIKESKFDYIEIN